MSEVIEVAPGPMNDGGSAFPVHDDAADMPGMSLRDWFAGQALTGYFAEEF